MALSCKSAAAETSCSSGTGESATRVGESAEAVMDLNKSLNA